MHQNIQRHWTYQRFRILHKEKDKQKHLYILFQFFGRYKNSLIFQDFRLKLFDQIWCSIWFYKYFNLNILYVSHVILRFFKSLHLQAISVLQSSELCTFKFLDINSFSFINQYKNILKFRLSHGFRGFQSLWLHLHFPIIIATFFYTLEQACQTQTHMWATQLYSKTKNLQLAAVLKHFLCKSPFILNMFQNKSV